MKLWTHDFVRIYLSNLLLFASVYMLLPVLPTYMMERFDTSLSVAGIVLALFALALFFVGPFYGYLIDTFKRKNVCMLSLLAVIALSGGFFVASALLWIAALRLAQGALFGIATTTESTLAIDITSSSRRNEANTCFGWAARLGMVLGAMTGLLLYEYFGLQYVLYASAILGGLGLLSVLPISVAFRAPIGASVCSKDRFLLVQGWLPAINLVVVSSVFGMLLPSIHIYTESIQMQYLTVCFFGLMAGGFVLAMIANKLIFIDVDIRAQVVCGFTLMVASLLLMVTHPESSALMTGAVLMGLGLGLVASDFLTIFVTLSEHCQRGTANTTYLLAWEVGIALGVAMGCYLIDFFSCTSVFYACIIAVIVALGFYLGLTNPYLRKKRFREVEN